MKEKNSRFRLIRRFAAGSGRYFLAAVAASFATTVINACTPQVFRFTIDSVLEGKEEELPGFLSGLVEQAGGLEALRNNLWLIAGVIILLALLSGAGTFLSRINTARAGENFAKNMRDTLFAHVQRLPMSWHEKHQTGDIIQRCTSDVEVIRNFTATQLLEVFRTLFLVTASFGIMFTMNVRLSLVVLAFIPVVALYSGIFFHLIAKRFTLADEAEGELSTVVQENATGVRVVRAFGREQFELQRFDEKNTGFAKLWIRLGSLSGVYWGIGDLITGFQVIAVIVLGTAAAIRGEITVGEFVAFASYNMNLVWPIRGLGRILSDMSKAGVSFDRVNYILDAQEETDSETEKEPEERGEISFERVSFTYDGVHPVLKEVSVHVPAGTTLGILGGTGSGKSTAVQLLDRLYELGPEEGTIRIGGKDIRTLSREWIRRNVGIVLQEPFLFSRTIRENIASAVPGATMEEIREAARIACVDETIMAFPDGYETLVGERGVTLSGGQRQRIAIARMILQKTPVMVFDDSLSAVDAQTDSRIRAALREFRAGITVILISHRVTTLMGAEQILVLHRGKAVQLGSHAELLKQEGIYRQIYEIQMSQDDRKMIEGGREHGGV